MQDSYFTRFHIEISIVLSAVYFHML